MIRFKASAGGKSKAADTSGDAGFERRAAALC
jgi:hypothetical protein